MKGEYLWKTGNQLADVRLLIEGAVVLFEDEASCLNRLAMNNGKFVAASAFDTIGTALYDLRKHIQEMHEDHIKEVVRTVEEEMAGVKDTN